VRDGAAQLTKPTMSSSEVDKFCHIRTRPMEIPAMDQSVVRGAGTTGTHDVLLLHSTVGGGRPMGDFEGGK